MAMFHVSFLVRATKLGDVMEDLDGKVANLEIRLAKSAPDHSTLRDSQGRIVSSDKAKRPARPSRQTDARTMVLQQIGAMGDEVLLRDLRKWRDAHGLSMTAIYAGLRQLVDEGTLVKVTKGVYHKTGFKDRQVA